MNLNPTEQKTLRAIVDRLIPADAYPAGWAGGVGNYLATHWEKDLAPLVPLLQTGIRALEAEALAIHNCSFVALQSAT